MLHRTAQLLCTSILTLTFGIGCANHAHHDSQIHRAVAVLSPTEGNSVKGVVEFTQTDEGVRIIAGISNLTPGEHGFHIHEWGDLRSTDGTATGGHFNPEGHDHGLPEKSERHAGDLGNLQADAQGNAQYSITVDNISLVGAKNPIVGRSVIIHAKVDDGGQPTGNAGARIAHGVIGVAKP